jgi:hypothetical protein
MSLNASKKVWAGTRHSGSELAMLLALADFADDNGRCYPSVTRLAVMCRTKLRNCQRVLAALQDSGELRVRMNAGPRGTNVYELVFSAMPGMQPDASLQADAPLQPDAGMQPDASLHSSAETHALECAKPLHHSAYEPSMNHQEPSDRSLTRQTPRIPACPLPKIVAIYHEVLPELPAVKMLDSKDRKKKINEFWRWIFTSPKSDGTKRAADTEAAMVWTRAYFQRARANDFIMGRTGRSEAHSNWRCDLAFLMTEKGRTQVIEKTVEA